MTAGAGGMPGVDVRLDAGAAPGAVTLDAAAADAAAAGAVAIGRHLLADLYGIAPELLRDGAALQALLCAAAHEAGARVLAAHFHSFGTNEGVTGVVLLAESHISIHTWPEHGFAAADMFMCGGSRPERALAVLVSVLAPARQDIQTQMRGTGSR